MLTECIIIWVFLFVFKSTFFQGIFFLCFFFLLHYLNVTLGVFLLLKYKVYLTVVSQVRGWTAALYAYL